MKKKKILIVEDSKSLRQMYETYVHNMEPDKYEVFTADNASQGLKAYHEIKPDCLILDFVLPDSNGLEILKELQASKIPQPIILITSYSNEELILDAMRSGAQNYISKEKITPESLIISIEHTIERLELIKKARVKQKEMEHFAKIIAHDLRDPLTSLDGTLQLLKMHNDDKKNLDEKSLEYIETAINCCAHIQDMIQDLYSYCNLEINKDKMQEFSGDDLVETIRNNLSSLIQEKEAELSFDQSFPELFGIKSLITQLFTNLIQNGIKYSKQQPKINVSCKDLQDHWQFTIQDNGIGIPYDEQDKVFDTFHRVDNQPDVEGSGLGLSICDKIAKIHRGDIWVESEPEKGSKFFFTLSKFKQS